MRKIRAYLLGMREFRLAWTTHIDDEAELNWYDRGRERAHRITRRRFDVE